MRSVRRGAALAAALSLAACGEAPAPAQPDVLLVVLDTVRADHTSTYGFHRPTTIQLDALARAGVVFEDATAPGSWTVPSHASLFTGAPPWVHGAHLVPPRAGESARFGMSVAPLRPDLPTLAERLAAAGYDTVARVANDWLDAELGLLRGFADARLLASDAAVVRSASEVIDAARERPLFLFVNLMSAHAPYYEGPGPWAAASAAVLDPGTAAPWARPYLTGKRRGLDLSRTPPGQAASGLTRYLRGDLAIPEEDLALLAHLYAAGVRGADFALGRILDAWTRSGRSGVVAVTADHGEAFGEHGRIEHRASVYPEVLRIPLVIAAPGRLPAGGRVRSPVQLEELHDTLLDLAGQGSAPRSLVPAASGALRRAPIAAVSYRDPYWAEAIGGPFDAHWRLYREGDLALVYADPGDAELYDLAVDPGMRDDRAGKSPERAAALLARARAHFGAERAAAAPATLSPELRARLAELGYAAQVEAPSPRAPAE